MRAPALFGTALAFVCADLAAAAPLAPAPAGWLAISGPRHDVTPVRHKKRSKRARASSPATGSPTADETSAATGPRNRSDGASGRKPAATVAPATLPQYDILKVCKVVAGGDAGLRQTLGRMSYQGCMEAEQRSSVELRRRWSGIPVSIRSDCVATEQALGTEVSSYSALRGCINGELLFAEFRKTHPEVSNASGLADAPARSARGSTIANPADELRQGGIGAGGSTGLGATPGTIGTGTGLGPLGTSTSTGIGGTGIGTGVGGINTGVGSSTGVNTGVGSGITPGTLGTSGTGTGLSGTGAGGTTGVGGTAGTGTSSTGAGASSGSGGASGGGR